MKRNDWALLISVLLYSILFYKQTAGINFFIFNIGVVVLLAFKDNSLIKKFRWISVAVGALASSFFIFMYGSALAIWANIFSLGILAIVSIAPASSFFIGLFVTLCSTCASCVFMILDWIARKKNKQAGEYKRPFYVKLFLIIIPLLIAILFFVFYRNANPLFYEFTKHINLDFISFQWIMFTISGLLLMYGFFNNHRLSFLVNADVNKPVDLTTEIASRKNFLNNLMRIDTERLSGVVLFVMLNLLLLLLNILDINYFLFDGKLPEGITHKEFVHDGIGALILSIIVAILIILFYFRGTLNFDSSNKWLKIMAILWIAQNVFMVISTAHRNNLYIQESGMTYKRIGVYCYLLFSLIGLIVTFVKIYKVKTNWYLFRLNATLFYFAFVAIGAFNWDMIISNYNIDKNLTEGKKLDKYYLLDLSYKNLPQLMKLPTDAIHFDDYAARDLYYSSRAVYFANFKTGLHNKFYNFLKDYYEIEWPSTCIEKRRVYHNLVAMKNDITELDLSQNYVPSLKPLYLFDNIHKLKLSNFSADSLEELILFPKIQSLELNSNNIKTIDELPPMNSLLELSLQSNNINDFSSLKKLTTLEKLNIANNYVTDISSLPEFRNLKELDLSDNKVRNLSVIKKYKTLETLNIRNTELNSADSIPYFLNLKSLNVSGNNLYYSYNAFKQITKHKDLKYLNISNNPLKDIDVLSNRYEKDIYFKYDASKNVPLEPLFSKLEELDASQCQLDKVFTIYIYKSLKKLNLSSNSINQIMPFVSLDKLEELNLSNNMIVEITKDIRLMKNLKILNLSNNQLKSYAALGGLSKLEILDLSNTAIKDINFLKTMKSLKKLDLSNNYIKDLSPVASLENLEEINLTNCMKEDFSFLLKLKKLKKITLLSPDRKLLMKLSKALPDVIIETVLNDNVYNERIF